MRPSSPHPAGAVPHTAGPSSVDPVAVLATSLTIPTTAAAVEAPAPGPVTPAPRRYDTRVGPAPPSPSHPLPCRRAPAPKRARTYGLGESSNSRTLEPHSPPAQRPPTDFPLDLSPALLIRRPTFHCGPIIGNSDCSAKELHDETFYDIPVAATLPEFRDSMRLMQQYSLEPFMTLCQFFYPRVVIEFYHTMTSRRVPHPTAIHFSFDGREGKLRVAATFNLPVVLANSVEYRQWPHPSPREMVRLLSKDTTTGSILFRRKLSPSFLLIDHIFWSNLFPLQHLVQRRGSILEALYRISESFWFSLAELIMTSLFHFKDKIHRRNLTRAESIPLLFSRLLCQVLEHLSFPAEPRLEHRRDCEAIFTINKRQLMPLAHNLPPPDLVKDQPIEDHPTEDQPPPIVHTEEPQIPIFAAPAVTAPLPTSPTSCAPPVPLTPSDSVGLSTLAPPL